MSENPLDNVPLRSVVRAIVDKTKAEIRVPEVRSAIVVAATLDAEFGRTVALVKIDGDPHDNPVAANNKTGLALAPGDRVSVQFDPPHGISVTGFAGDENLLASRVNWIVPFTYDATLAVSESSRYYPGDLGATCYAAIASLGTPGTADTVIELRVNGCTMDEIRIPAGVYVVQQTDLGIGCSAMDWMTTAITSDGTGAAKLNVQWFLRPGGMSDLSGCGGGPM